MKSAKIQKSKLLEVIRKNRDEHKSIFEEALIGYRKEAIRLLDERLNDARDGRKIDLYFHLVQPMDQTKDYDRVIMMLEMTEDEIIELTSTEFSNYVQDDWSWKDQFITSNSTYSAKAAKMIK